MKIKPDRIKVIKDGISGEGAVVYWMQRDQRIQDNWALLYAQQLALETQTPLAVIFNLVPQFLGAGYRQYDLMIKGLEQIERKLNDYQIPFFLLMGEPAVEIPDFIKKFDVDVLISDFNPLRIIQQWKTTVAEQINIPFYEVDAHNIIPCWKTSEKQEYAARTIRPKIERLLNDFLEIFPSLQEHPISWRNDRFTPDWRGIQQKLKINQGITPVTPFESGEGAAKHTLTEFIKHRLPRYAEKRNDPNADAVSNLSPYLHFGQISAQGVAVAVGSQRNAHPEAVDAFLEELIVRRELSDNFCYYNPNYDRFSGCPDWAQKTLNDHRHDRREYVYSFDEFEQAQTHDDLWNASQMEMVLRGKMHGYMRMYWAKKILEWTPTPEDALQFAIDLNDRYELDGRDPNGYVGVMWSMGGVHDRAWKERPVFGKIRYMNRNGCQRKFDVEKYIKRWYNK